MNMPNFIIIGAAKSGTTSIYNYLQQHPQIFMTDKKETNFFVYENKMPEYYWWGSPSESILKSISDLDQYQTLFQGREEKALGEASVLYLYDQSAPERIAKYIPRVKLIAILRNPVDRAYSHYMNLRRDGREPHADFLQALQEEQIRKENNWSWDYFYTDFGYYHQQLLRYYELFPNQNIRVFLYEDLVSKPQELLIEIFNFLGVNPTFTPDISFRFNPSGEPKSLWLQKTVVGESKFKDIIKLLLPQNLRRQIRQNLFGYNLQKIPMEQETRKYLSSLFASDIKNLQDLLHRDLSHWLL
jgi:hypothetical protein